MKDAETFILWLREGGGKRIYIGQGILIRQEKKIEKTIHEMNT